MDAASIIGIVNQKGGTGKTTTCVNLGVDLAHEGKRVLLVDCDPQASLTISLGHPQPDTLPVTLADLMGSALNSDSVNPGEGILRCRTVQVSQLPFVGIFKAQAHGKGFSPAFDAPHRPCC